MNEHIVAAVIRLDEAVALGCVKPLHGSHAHGIVPSQIATAETHLWRAGEIESLGGAAAPEPAVPRDSQWRTTDNRVPVDYWTDGGHEFLTGLQSIYKGG